VVTLLVVPEPPISYIGAQAVGLVSSVPRSVRDEAHVGNQAVGQVSVLPSLVARQMGRQAVEAVVMVNNNGPRNETMCREVTSSQCRLEENNAIRGGSDPLVSCTRASEQIDELSEHSEASRHEDREQRRSLENLRAEFNEELRVQQAMFLNARDEFESRQADALANAWAVLQNSLANLRNPTEVNTGSRVADRTSPVRSVESETRVETTPRGEEGKQRVTGSVSTNAAPGPVVYPSEFRLGVPAELGGQGMTQGGMPSGVPPSVYLTPVDAMNQQYMSGDVTMIPSGIPLGVPSSAYCTPIDPSNARRMHRDMISSVYGNAMQYTPELYSPMESAYYTAPNTSRGVLPQSNWSTKATPGNSQSRNEATLSQDRAEAESGLADQQVSGTRPSPGSAETGNRKAVRYAALDDEGRVILFASSDSDVPDASENRTVEKSES